MTDNELIRLFLPIIKAGLVDDGFTNVTVVQSYQPTQQGANSGPTIYFYKLGDHRYGWRRATDEWDEENSRMVHTEIQFYETSFQVSSLVTQRPQVPLSYTASDLVNEVAAILQSDKTIVTLNNSDVGILRVTEVRNPYFTDDRDQYEASPSFDFVLTHKQTRVSYSPVIESVEYNFNRV